MAKPLGVWGIDIGQCALKAMRLEMIDGAPTVTAFDYIEHPKVLSQPDADPDALTREALEKFLSRNPIKNDQIAIGVPGQSGLARFVKLPPVEEKKVPDIVKFEAKQQIPFPLEEVVWDFQKIHGGEAVGGFATDTEIGLFAMKRDIIARFLGHYQSVKAEVHVIQMAPLALCNYATYDILKRGGPGGIEGDAPPPEVDDGVPKNKRRCAVVLDIGTDGSNLIITDGLKIIWQRALPLGGNNFTRALIKDMKLTFAKAEHLKRNAAKSPELANILKSLRPILSDFVGEVQRSLGFFTNTHRDAHVSYLIGLGSAFKLPGLQKYLSEKLSLDVRKPTQFERLVGEQVLSDPTFTDNILTFAVSYGLALQGLGISRIHTNLLPGEIRTDRMIRAKKPWAAFAAASLLLGSGVLAYGFGVEYKASADEKVKTAMKSGETQIEAAKKQEASRKSKIGEKDTGITALQAIVSGNNERLNWTRLMEVIQTSMPKPVLAGETDGNLNKPNQVRYWNDTKNQLAIRKQRERVANGISLDSIFEDDLTENLPVVNIEAIDCRYSENLQDFLNNAQLFASEAQSALKIEKEFPPADRIKYERDKRLFDKFDESLKAPAGNGWVIEIRGYTNYKTTTGNSAQFLNDCFVENLRNIDTIIKDSEGKVGEMIGMPKLADPVKGRIDRVFLAVAFTNEASKRAAPTTTTIQPVTPPVTIGPGTTANPWAPNFQGQFGYIHSTYLDKLVFPKPPEGTATPTPGTPSPSPEGPPGTTPTATPTTWRSLVGQSSVPVGSTGRGGTTTPQPSTGTTTPAPQLATGKPKDMTEFIIYFIWREPGSDTPKVEPPK